MVKKKALRVETGNIFPWNPLKKSKGWYVFKCILEKSIKNISDANRKCKLVKLCNFVFIPCWFNKVSTNFCM